MKNILYIPIVLLLAMITSCDKISPSQEDGDETSGSYIFFEPEVYEVVTTKLVEGNKLPADEGTAFGVLGYYGSSSLFKTVYSSTNEVARVYRPTGSNSSEPLPFQYDNLVLWRHSTENHNFYAFYPYSIYQDVEHNVINNVADPYIEYTQPTANDATMVDIMTAYTSTSLSDNVNLTFFHRLWALDIIIKNDQTSGVNSSDVIIDNPTITIKSVSVKVDAFPTGAKIYLNKDNATSGMVLNTDANNKITVTSAASTYTLNSFNASGDVIQKSATKQYGSLTFLPVQAKMFKYSLEITYLDSRGVESTFSTGEAKTLDKEFEAGKKYTLTVSKTNDSFVVGTLSHTDWTDHDRVDHEFN